VFPSLLETWGLPISEAKEYAKPIILADLPYAHETLGSYNCARFFNPYSVTDLVNIFEDIIDGKAVFEEVDYIQNEQFYDWDETVQLLLSNSKNK